MCIRDRFSPELWICSNIPRLKVARTRPVALLLDHVRDVTRKPGMCDKSVHYVTNQPCLLFTGKERTNMAAFSAAQIRRTHTHTHTHSHTKQLLLLTEQTFEACKCTVCTFSDQLVFSALSEELHVNHLPNRRTPASHKTAGGKRCKH